MSGLEDTRQSAPKHAVIINLVRARGTERDRVRQGSWARSSSPRLKATAGQKWAKAEGAEA